MKIIKKESISLVCACGSWCFYIYLHTVFILLVYSYDPYYVLLNTPTFSCTVYLCFVNQASGAAFYFEGFQHAY